ncbi:PIG-L deacetylase family protein [Streptomyces sp. NPDC023723]|uniref:PIG-L deacetylase family protein n=1 Tax=Streptomyces sp. NPDC023723 TaxID=3154323 RepID=UPI0033D3A01D
MPTFCNGDRTWALHAGQQAVSLPAPSDPAAHSGPGLGLAQNPLRVQLRRPVPPQPPSLLAVFAHPDDESLLAGGVLAQHRASGARTGVVTTTWSPVSHRADELRDALAVLGAGSPRMLGYRDARNESSAPDRSRLCDTPVGEVVEDLVVWIRRFRPDAVVTHDALGQMTGHPDHRSTHQATVLAVEAAAIGSFLPEHGRPWHTRALYFATHTESGADPLAAVLANVGKSTLTVPDAYASVTVDVSEWLPLKWQAIQAHRSQVAAARPLPGLLARMPSAQREDILRTEVFTRMSLGPVPASSTVLTC